MGKEGEHKPNTVGFNYRGTEAFIKSAREKVDREKRARRDAVLRKQKKEREIHMAINTLAAVSTIELSDTGVDQDRYSVMLESRGLQPKDGESAVELVRRAARTLIRAGFSVEEVSEKIMNNRSSERASLSLGTYTKGNQEYDEALLANSVARIFNSAMGHKSR